MPTILESFIGSCAKKLQDIVTEEAILILGVKEELIELQRRMEQIRCFVNDAEQRSIKESAVSNWVCQLRDAMYDADDIIDLARSKGSKILPDHSSSLSSSSNSCSGLSLFSCFSNIETRREVVVKIRNLNKRIDNIKKDKVFASFKSTQPAVTVLAPNQRRSSSLVEPNLVGKEVIHAYRKLVDLVLAHKEKRSYKLAIVGTGGVGKTTLAQKIYNDQKLKGSFNKQAWVCVSKNLGFDIVRRCGGLPLAIKVIARVLACKDPTENEWKKILGKDAWSVTKLPSEITSALYLSYEELPHHLKQCFIYCALWPEDSVIHRSDIVRMWIAEGFVDKQDDQLLEDIAEEYYSELIYRNLLQPDDSVVDFSRCRMHDLLRQLACHLSREECFVGDLESTGVNVISKFRRISIVTTKDMVVLPRMDKEKCKVRTMTKLLTKSLKIDDAVFERFPCIRILDLTGSHIQNIPSCIGRLIHLRLLDLDRTDISFLPESICCLTNLQILNLDGCDSLHSLPSGITQLRNLRRLGLQETPINEVPQGIGRLTFLNDLQGFPVHGGSYNNSRIQDGWNLEELDPLWQLRRLWMIKLERALPPSKDTLLANKEHLRELLLCCTEDRHEPYSEDAVINIEKTFDLLIPANNLEDLCFINFFGWRFPIWLDTATHLPSLTYLNFIDCKSCLHLPPIGQLPNLKYLRIDGATAVTKIGPEFVGSGVGNLRSTEAVAFPKLETLVIWNMPNLEEWSFVAEEKQEASTESMEGAEDETVANQNGDAPPPSMQLLPRLKILKLHRCPKLRALPPRLGQEATSLKELQLRKAHSLKVVENLCFLS